MPVLQTLSEGPESANPTIAEIPPESDIPAQNPTIPHGKPRIAPKPRHFKYSSSAGKGMQPNDFFAYWERLPADIKGQCKVYVYMNWPVIARPSPTKKNPSHTTHQLDMLAGEDVIHDEDEFLHRYSSGDFLIRLNEQVVQNKTICMCTLRLRDNEHPPHVPDLNWLDRDDPANTSYINQLRERGIQLPWESVPEMQEEEDEMAVNTAVVEQLGSTVERLADKVIAQGNQQKATEQPAQSIDTAAAKASMDLIKEGGSIAQKMVQDAVTRASEVAGKQGDPLELLTKLAGVLKAIMPPPPQPDTSAMETFKLILAQQAEHHKTITTLLQSRIDHLETEATRMRTEAVAGGPAHAPTLADQLRGLLELKDSLASLLGHGEEGEPAAGGGGGKAPTWLQFAGPLLNGAAAIVGGFANAAYNAAVAKTGTGQPQAPPAAAPANAEQPGAPGELPGAAQPEESVNPYIFILQNVRQPLMDALNNGLSGYTFAENMIEYHGEGLYAAIKQLGKANLYTIIQRYDMALWTFLQTISQKANTFMDEFLDYENWAKQQEAEAEAEPAAESADEQPPEAPPPAARGSGPGGSGGRRQRAASPGKQGA
jgi:hypothetical protein